MHVLAQVNQFIRRPSPVIVATAAAVTAATASVALGLQFGYGGDMSSTLLTPDWKQHAAAGAGLVGGGLVVAAMQPRNLFPPLVGVAIGAAAGAYLVTPVAHRLNAGD